MVVAIACPTPLWTCSSTPLLPVPSQPATLHPLPGPTLLPHLQKPFNCLPGVLTVGSDPASSIGARPSPSDRASGSGANTLYSTFATAGDSVGSNGAEPNKIRLEFPCWLRKERKIQPTDIIFSNNPVLLIWYNSTSGYLRKVDCRNLLHKKKHTHIHLDPPFEKQSKIENFSSSTNGSEEVFVLPYQETQGGVYHHLFLY